MGRHPDASLPEATVSIAALEGAYRFLNNSRVTFEKVLQPHVDEALQSCRSRPEVLVVHDDTEFVFGGRAEREGLGRIRTRGQGFRGHFALAVSADGRREPIGVLDVLSIVRSGPPTKKTATERREDPERESLRWTDSIRNVESKLGVARHAIHVMDREADSYEILSALVTNEQRFVVRARGDRRVLDEDASTIRDLFSRGGLRTVLTRDVRLSSRAEQIGVQKKIHPERAARTAKLSVHVVAAVLSRPRYSDELTKSWPKTLEVNLVRVFERKPPRGEPGVEWILATSEPIKTRKDVARVVDIYRARWTIEEYFKALKTGCSYERRQLESFHALQNMLALLVPIAVHLLARRAAARDRPERPASELFRASEIAVLTALMKQARWPLPAQLTVQDAMRAVARLGGHLPQNGDPGWLVLWRGSTNLAVAEAAWVAARSDR